MRIKDRPNDFRVDELLREGVVLASGPHRVYRVTKRKHTSLEAARVLARLAEVPPSQVSLAGLKDRQGVTTQYMSVPRGRPVEHRSEGLTIRSEGFARGPIDADCSLGNAFRLKLRDVRPRERASLESGLEAIAREGLPNYYDEQRFGNLRHGQGWIARDLALGRTEEALRALLGAPSPHDDTNTRRFKEGLRRSWGDWQECRRLAGRFGAHHSVFEHLRRSPEDFAGAFRHVSIRVRLIHLYALQSHLWNRAVAALVAQRCGPAGAWCSDGIDGPLLFPAVEADFAAGAPATFRLPGPRLEDVEDPEQRELLVDALAQLRLVPDAFHVDGIAGFQLKGEDRELLVRPRSLTWSFAGSERDGGETATVAFELPRGAYASLLVRRLQARFVRGPVRARDLRELARPRGGRGAGARHERDESDPPARGGRRWVAQNAPPPEGGERWSRGGRRQQGRPSGERAGGRAEGRASERERDSERRGERGGASGDPRQGARGRGGAGRTKYERGGRGRRPGGGAGRRPGE